MHRALISTPAKVVLKTNARLRARHAVCRALGNDEGFPTDDAAFMAELASEAQRRMKPGKNKRAMLEVTWRVRDGAAKVCARISHIPLHKAEIVSDFFLCCPYVRMSCEYHVWLCRRAHRSNAMYAQARAR